MTREQLTGAIAALEEIEQLRNIRTFPLDCIMHLRCKYRAQLAALPEPAQPWADRERRLREALKHQENALCIIRDRQIGRVSVEDLEQGIRQIRAALAEAPSPDPASVESVLSAVHRDDAERAIERLHGPAQPDPRDEALEEIERVVAWYGGDATGCNAQVLLEKVIAAIARAKGGTRE